MKSFLPMVFIADDDPSVRKSLSRIVKSAGYKVMAFASAEDFLQRSLYGGPRCLVLDVRLPGKSGIDLQQELARENTSIPIIFITGHGNIPMTVKAIKGGAVDFLPKPFEDEQLLAAIEKAIANDKKRRKKEIERGTLQSKIDALTPREYEVLRWVITGMLNKQIASELGVTEKTIKVHRARAMKKLHASSVADLVRFTQKCGISPAKE